MSARHWMIIAVVAVIAGLATRQPAAADTGTLTLAEPKNYTAPCPVTLHFSGTITGVPSSQVVYYFANYAGGAWTNTANVSTTIPPGGSLPISSQLVVDSAHAGFQSYEIKIATPSAGNDLSNAKVYFTVTCGAAQPNISNPYALNATKDPGVCTQYFGAPLFASLACSAAIQDDEVVFIWKFPAPCFQKGPCSADIDGYRIYRSSDNKLIKQVTNPQQFATGSDVKASTSAGQCFYATAYKGGAESSHSNTYCSGGGEPLKTVALDPSNMLDAERYYYKSTSGGFCFGTSPYWASGPSAWATKQLEVGFSEQDNGSIGCTDWRTEAFRGAVKFDLSSLAGKIVQKATLAFHIDKSIPSFPLPLNCADGVYASTSDWTVHQPDGTGKWVGTISVGDYVGDVQQNGTSNVNVDVTNRVNSWIRGDAANNGFVMKGKMENVKTQGNDKCATFYGKFKLTVTYFNT